MYGNNHIEHGFRPMLVTPGFTSKKFARLPLADEAEATPGDDLTNPFRSERERREVEAVLEQREERREQEDRPGDAFLATIPSERPRIKQGDPTAGDDPFAFDDVEMGAIGHTDAFDSIDEVGSGPSEENGPETRHHNPLVFDDVPLGRIDDTKAFDSIGDGNVHPIVRPLEEDGPQF